MRLTRPCDNKGPLIPRCRVAAWRHFKRMNFFRGGQGASRAENVRGLTEGHARTSIALGRPADMNAVTTMQQVNDISET